MNKLRRYFNQNREKIVRIVVPIVFGLFLLYFANGMVANKNKYINQGTTNLQNENSNSSNINTNSALNIGSSSNSKDTSYTKDTDIITKFIEYCNEANTTAAYNMLSNECKENIYPTLDNFVTNYHKNNFESNKIFNIQRWTGSIYKVDLKENLLQTGKLTSEAKQDYMTIVSQNGEYKLNINNYIGRTNMNKEKTEGNLKIEILYKDTYMDYETYTFQIKNSSGKEIYLDNLEETSTIYLVDENQIKHTAYTHKIAKEELHIYGHSSKTIQITFSNRYISGRENSKIVFGNVIMDNEKNKNIAINID